jgi:hypothetical protein
MPAGASQPHPVGPLPQIGMIDEGRESQHGETRGPLGQNSEKHTYCCRITRPLAAELVGGRARNREFRCRIAQEDQEITRSETRLNRSIQSIVFDQEMALPFSLIPIARQVNGSPGGSQPDGKADLTSETHPLERRTDVSHARVNDCFN